MSRSSYDTQIFNSQKNYNEFLSEGYKQLCRHKFGNKDNLISEANKKFSCSLSDSYSYERIIEEIGYDKFFQDLLGTRNKAEAATISVTYKLFQDFFSASSYGPSINNFYKLYSDEKPEINDTSDLNNAIKFILKKNEETEELITNWIDFSVNENYPPVLHESNRTIGPLGPVISLYDREIIGYEGSKPHLDIIFSRDQTSDSAIIDIERTDMVKVLSELLNAMKGEQMNFFEEKVPPYYQYLDEIIGIENIEDTIDNFRQNIGNLSKKFSERMKENKLPDEYLVISQLSALLLSQDNLISILNYLIAQNSLKINKERKIGRRIKITQYGIIRKENIYGGEEAAFRLAKDISEIREGNSKKENFQPILRDFAKKGPLEYLKNLYNNDYEIFKELCAKNKILIPLNTERGKIPGRELRKVLLECYGVEIPSKNYLSIKKDTTGYLEQLKKFEDNYSDINEDLLEQRLINLLGNGRIHLERFLKEEFFIISALTIQFEKENEEPFTRPSPILGFSIYRTEEKLNEREQEYSKFISSLKNFANNELKSKIERFEREGNPNFSLGDWHQLLKANEKYLKEQGCEQEFWGKLPDHFEENTKELLDDLEDFIQNKLEILNIANHETGMRELRSDIEKRNEAIDLILQLREIIVDFYSRMPKPYEVVEETKEIESGLTTYKAESYVVSKGKIQDKIIGSSIRTTSYTYYVIPLSQQGDEKIYPILITNLVDNFL